MDFSLLDIPIAYRIITMQCRFRGTTNPSLMCLLGVACTVNDDDLCTVSLVTFIFFRLVEPHPHSHLICAWFLRKNILAKT